MNSQVGQSLVGRTIQNTEATTPIKYNVLEWLYSNGVVDTYLVTQAAVNVKVELKAIKPALTAQVGFSARFIAQAKALLAINAPNLIKLYDYGRDGANFFFVVEHHKSPTVRERIAKEGPFPLLLALDYARIVVESLGYAESGGMLHGLLSPLSLVITSRRGPLIGDFGLSALLGELLPGVLVNTPQLSSYAAPEVLFGQPLSTASDLYSMAAILYEMATGQTPFSGLTAMQIATAPTPNPSQVDPALEPLGQIIGRGLAKDPANRFQTYNDFNNAIQDLITALKAGESSAQPLPGERSTEPEAAPGAVQKPTEPEVSSRPPLRAEPVSADLTGGTIAEMPTPAPPKPGANQGNYYVGTVVGMPESSAPAKVPSTPPPKTQPKTEKVEENFGGGTIVDMPAFAPPSKMPTPPPPTAQPKTESIEENFGGGTIVDMPVAFSAPAKTPSIPPVAAPPPKYETNKADSGAKEVVEISGTIPPPVTPAARTPPPLPTFKSPPAQAAARTPPPLPSFKTPPSVPAAKPPTPPPAVNQPPKNEPPNQPFGRQTLLEIPGESHSRPPSIVPSSMPPTPSYPGPQQTVPRSVENRYRTGAIEDQPSAAPYASVPPSYAGPQRTVPRQVSEKYSTGTFGKAEADDTGPSSGITGFISRPKSEGKPEKKRGGGGIVIILGIVLLLIVAAAIGFFVLHLIGVIH